MSETMLNTLVFVFVFVVVPWGFIFILRLVGRRRGMPTWSPRRRGNRRLIGRCAADSTSSTAGRPRGPRPATATNAAGTAGRPATSRWWLHRRRFFPPHAKEQVNDLLLRVFAAVSLWASPLLYP